MATSKSLEKVIDKEHVFNFRPYSYTSQAIIKAQLLEEKGGETSLVIPKACLMTAQTLVVIMEPTLLSSKLKPWKVLALQPPAGT